VQFHDFKIHSRDLILTYTNLNLCISLRSQLFTYSIFVGSTLLRITCIAGFLQFAFLADTATQRWTNAFETSPIIAAHVDPLCSTVAATIVTGHTRQLSVPKQPGDAPTVALPIPVRLPSYASALVDVQARLEPRQTRLICDRAPPRHAISAQ
jgi:hypothetical protein